MKPPATFATTLLSVCKRILASPLNTDIEATSSNTTDQVDAAAEGCIIRTWENEDCTGSGWESWEFTPSGCRSCEGVGGDAHAFSTAGNCPWGYISAHDAEDCGGNKGHVVFEGPGCYHVDTGIPWITFRPCFDA